MPPLDIGSRIPAVYYLANSDAQNRDTPGSLRNHLEHRAIAMAAAPEGCAIQVAALVHYQSGHRIVAIFLAFDEAVQRWHRAAHRDLIHAAYLVRATVFGGAVEIAQGIHH